MWTFFDTSIVIIYLAALIWMSFYLKARVKGLSDFLVAGRQMSWWAAALSIFASYNSVWAFTGAVGFAYGVGMPVLFFYFGSCAGSLMSAYLAPRIRATRGLSIFNYFEKRFPGNLRPLISIIKGFAYTLDIGNRLFATAIVPAVFLGWATNSTVVMIFVFTAFYVTMSGMKGVIISDIIQGTIMFVVLVSAVFIGLYGIGGLGALARTIDPLYFNPVNARFPFFQMPCTLFCSIFYSVYKYRYHEQQALDHKYMCGCQKSGAGRRRLGV